MAPTVRHLYSARVKVVTGTSATAERVFDGPIPHWARLGCARTADWRIEGPGIAPAHCELLWDGHGLYVQDRLRLGRTYLEGRRVDAWRPLEGSVFVYLGNTCLRIDAPRSARAQPDQGALRWVQAQLMSDVEAPSGPITGRYVRHGAG